MRAFPFKGLIWYLCCTCGNKVIVWSVPLCSYSFPELSKTVATLPTKVYKHCHFRNAEYICLEDKCATAHHSQTHYSRSHCDPEWSSESTDADTASNCSTPTCHTNFTSDINTEAGFTEAVNYKHSRLVFTPTNPTSLSHKLHRIKQCSAKAAFSEPLTHYFAV